MDKLTGRDLTEKRGLVICPPTKIDGDDIHVAMALDPQELRYATLFWDELVWPNNWLIEIPAGDDEIYLNSLGILNRKVVQISEYGANAIISVHLGVFHKLDQAEPGKWSLATGENSFNWLQIPPGNEPGVVFELFRAIPVPKEDVPLGEILEFKFKRRDEVFRLRQEVDGLALAVKQSADPQASVMAKKHEIEMACTDLLRAGIEWKFPVRIANLKCSFEISGTQILTALGAAGLSQMVFSMPAVGALIGGAASLIKVSGDIQRQPIRPRPGPYHYVYSFHNELF